MCKRGFKALFDLVLCPSFTCERSEVYCRECFVEGFFQRNSSDADSDQNLHGGGSETNKLQFVQEEDSEEMDSKSFYPLLKILVDAPTLQEKEDHCSYSPEKQSRDEDATTDKNYVLDETSKRNAKSSGPCHTQNSSESNRNVCASRNPPRILAIRRVSSFSGEFDNFSELL